MKTCDVQTYLLALVDAGLSSPRETFQCLADDLEAALEVYERSYGNGSKPQPCSLRTGMLSDEDATPLEGLPNATRIYALSCTDSPDAGDAVAALEQLRTQCAEAGLTWSGGVAIPGGRLVLPCSHGPRMGRMRRSRSEAIDRLVLAMRCGCSLADLMSSEQALSERNPRTRKPNDTDADILVARCPVPACLYYHVTAFYESHS